MYRLLAAHFSLLAIFPLTERPSFGRFKENRIFPLEFIPYFEHDNAHFISISPAASLSDHMFPLIRRGTDDQYIAQSLWSYIPSCIMADPSFA